MSLDGGSPTDLNTVRGKKGVSLQDISQATKIRVHYLEAIETGEFAKLPGGIYSVSYIRQYARAIDYNESELLDRFYQTMEPVPDVAAPGGNLDSAANGAFAEIQRTVRRLAS
jgi:cytoskeletal protein RodZ